VAVNPSLCPVVSRAVSRRMPAEKVGAPGGARRTLAGEQGVLTRVRVALPEKATELTVKVSRKGGGPETGTWNRHNGISGVSARVVSGNPRATIQNIANCRPTEPRTGKQVCTIALDRGQIDHRQFVTVEVLATREGEPILLEAAGT
jgi:hypothetical protein